MASEDAGQSGEDFRARSTRLPGSALKALQKLSPLRATLSLVQSFGAIALLFAIAQWSQHPLVIALCMIGIAAQQHALAILTHQSAHYRMYKSRWLNDLVGRLCGIPVFASMVTYRIIHRLHHNRLWSVVDPDLALVAGYPRGKAYLIRKLVKDLFGLTTLKNYAYFLGRHSSQHSGDEQRERTILDDTSPRLRAAAAFDRRLMLAVHLIVWPILIALGWWKIALGMWMIPLLTFTQALLRLRAVCEHGGAPDHEDPLRAARTNLSPWWIRWWLFPHNMHYHIEHHLYPGVPHYRLRECHLAMVEHGLLENAEVMTVFQCFETVFASPREQALESLP